MYRVLNEAGTDYRFFHHGMQQAIEDYIARKLVDDNERIKKSDVLHMIAEEACVTTDAVKNWRRGTNGPSDMATVKKIAQVLSVDYKKLVQRVDSLNDGGKAVNTANGFDTTREAKEVILEIYNRMIEYVYMYPGSEEYNYVPSNPELEEPWKYYEQYIDEMNCYLDKNALIIDDDTYDKLHRLISELRDTLYDAFDCCNVVDRWCEVNPLIRKIMQLGGEHEKYWLGDSHFEPFEKKLAEEIGIRYKEIQRLVKKPGKKTIDVGETFIGPDIHHAYPSTEMLWAGEVAKAIKILFRSEFKQILGER